MIAWTLSPNLSLAFLVVAPALFWGIWIVSEESFDALNSLNQEKFLGQWRRLGSSVPKQNFKIPRQESVSGNAKNEFDLKQVLDAGQSKSRASIDESARNFRKMFLPIFFMVVLIAFLLIFFVILQKTKALFPVVILVLLVTLFVLHSKGSSKRLLLAQSKNLEAELPTQIQLLTILVSAGISPAQAIAILSKRSNSISSKAFENVFVDIENGYSIIEALDNLKDRFTSNSLRRFATSLILGIERGSALAPILIAQVRDSRLVSKSEIMRRAGKAEIGLMVPVVFLILPISIIFALFPSYQQLGSFV